MRLRHATQACEARTALGRMKARGMTCGCWCDTAGRGVEFVVVEVDTAEAGLEVKPELEPPEDEEEVMSDETDVECEWPEYEVEVGEGEAVVADPSERECP